MGMLALERGPATLASEDARDEQRHPSMPFAENTGQIQMNTGIITVVTMIR